MHGRPQKCCHVTSKEVGRYFVKYQHYLLSLFTKNVYKRYVGDQKFSKFGHRSLRMTPIVICGNVIAVAAH